MRLLKMRHMVVGAIFLHALLTAWGADRIDLGGSGWTFRTTLDPIPVEVTVPHCWPTMEKYRSYIGDAIYEHDFNAPPVKKGHVARLHFDAVFDVATIWLNGRRLGTHEGG